MRSDQVICVFRTKCGAVRTEIDFSGRPPITVEVMLMPSHAISFAPVAAPDPRSTPQRRVFELVRLNEVEHVKFAHYRER